MAELFVLIVLAVIVLALLVMLGMTMKHFADSTTTTIHRQDQQLRFFGDRMLAVSEQASEMIRLDREDPAPKKEATRQPFYGPDRSPHIPDSSFTLDTITDPVGASIRNGG